MDKFRDLATVRFEVQIRVRVRVSVRVCKGPCGALQLFCSPPIHNLI